MICFILGSKKPMLCFLGFLTGRYSIMQETKASNTVLKLGLTFDYGVFMILLFFLNPSVTNEAQCDENVKINKYAIIKQLVLKRVCSRCTRYLNTG